MASPRNIEESDIKDFMAKARHSTECFICREVMTNPVTTCCGHSFCQVCINDFVSNIQGLISCPQCKNTINKTTLKENKKLNQLISGIQEFLCSVSEEGGWDKEIFWKCQKKSLTSPMPEPRRSYLRETKKQGPSTSTPINSYSRTDRLKRTNAVDIRSPEPNAKVKNWLDTVDPTINPDSQEVSTTSSANKFFRNKSSSPSTVIEEPPVQENIADPFEFHSSQNVKEVAKSSRGRGRGRARGRGRGATSKKNSTPAPGHASENDSEVEVGLFISHPSDTEKRPRTYKKRLSTKGRSSVQKSIEKVKENQSEFEQVEALRSGFEEVDRFDLFTGVSPVKSSPKRNSIENAITAPAAQISNASKTPLSPVANRDANNPSLSDHSTRVPTQTTEDQGIPAPRSRRRIDSTNSSAAETVPMEGSRARSLRCGTPDTVINDVNSPMKRNNDPKIDVDPTPLPEVIPSHVGGRNIFLDSNVEPVDMEVDDPLPTPPAVTAPPESREGSQQQNFNPDLSVANPPVTSTPAVPPRRLSSSARNRLTFSMEAETQDLMNLSAELHQKDYTQNQFCQVGATPSERPPTSVPTPAPRIDIAAVDTSAPAFCRVSFLQIGSLNPFKQNVRMHISFHVLGKLERDSRPSEIPQTLPPVVTKETSHQSTQTEGQPIPAVESESKEVQTDEILTSTVCIQTDEPMESVKKCSSSSAAGPSSIEIVSQISVKSPTKTSSTPINGQESFPLNSVDFILPTIPAKANQMDKARIEDVDIIESDSDTDEASRTVKQTKRARRISSSSETDSQEAKRPRSTSPSANDGINTTLKPEAAVELTCRTPPKSETTAEAAVAQMEEEHGQITPHRTRVVESDQESEDLFRTDTPDVRPKRNGKMEKIKQTPVCVCSGLPRSQIKLVEELKNRLGADMLQTFDKRVTHVIVRVDDENSAERTLKFLYGVAGRKWIVSIEWVRQCLKEGRYVAEDNYEVLDMDGENGPWRSRHCRSLLFTGFEFCCMEPFTDVSVDQLRELLELCGGNTVESPSDLTKKFKYSLIVVQTDTGFHPQPADSWFRQYKVLCVSREWVLDCIASYHLFPVRSQLIGSHINPSLLQKMGYPAELID